MKHLRYLHVLGAVLLLSFPAAVCSQQSTDSIVSHLQQHVSGKPAELVYLQTSKGIYETGEDLWFKGYQLDAQTFGLSNKSKTFYLQLVNSTDSIVWQEKYPIENGIASGHVYLNEQLREGDYWLEGYTKGSFYKNDTTSIRSSRKVRIVKNISRIGTNECPKDSSFRFEMFPEGGNLVSGILSKLAFKATDGKGNPATVEGTLYQDNQSCCDIKSTHDGMGILLFVPLQGKSYRIALKNGKSYSLPDIQANGITLQLAKQGKELLSFVITQTNGLPNQRIYLMGQMRGMLCCIAQGVLKERLKIDIPVQDFLYQGIAEFTLLNEQLQPMAERLVYLHPEKKLHITAEPEKKSFTIREKAALKIKVTDEDGKPVRANLGISVYDQAYNNPADPVNLLTHCYLSSQIRGKIHNPVYYFDQENKDRLQAMDLLLLTQGWRCYVWRATNPVCSGQMFLTDEINGVQTIESKKKEKQPQGSNQLIQVSGAEGDSQFIWTDSIGQFTVSTDMMKELRGGYVYVKPMLTKEFKPTLDIKDSFSEIDNSPKGKQAYYPFIHFTQISKEQILDLPVIGNDSTILLSEVTITAKGHQPFRDKMMGRLDSLMQMNARTAWVCGSCGFLLNYESGYDAHHAVNDCPAKSMNPPIDGHTYEIAKFEHFAPTSTGIPFRVIDRRQVVYHANHYSEEELLKMNNLWRTKGYYVTREFYQPDEVDIHLSIPDARNTLLWTPSTITNEKGEATVSFYCSDINTGFTGLVEGVDGTGLLGSTKCEFRVIR